MAETKPCPYCGEIIKETAVKCRFCGEWLNEGRITPPSTDHFTLVRMALASRYELIEEIGRGGMAYVYKAIQKNLERQIALKVLSPQAILDSEFLERFHREARTAAKLQHQNIVMIYDEGTESGVHFIAMEYLDGADLHTLIKRKGKLSQDETIKIIIPIAQALDYAHSRNIVHRDIKSANIFVTNSGRPVLTDFGIAHAAVGTQLTMSGTVLGTPEFMSPEQANGKLIDHRSDIYSLGIVMYQALTGRLPFEGGNPLTLIYKVINEPHTPLANISSLPLWLEKAVEGCLIKDPSKRIQSGQELADLLINKKTTNREDKSSASRTVKVSTEKFEEPEKPVRLIKKSVTPDEAKRRPVQTEQKKDSSGISIGILASIFFVLIVIAIVVFSSGGNEENKTQENVVKPKIDYSPRQYIPPVQNNDTKTNDFKKEIEKPPEPKKEIVVEQKVKVPSVINLSPEAAARILRNNGLQLGTISKLPTGSGKKGVVFRQVPPAGTKLKRGSTVNLIIGE